MKEQSLYQPSPFDAIRHLEAGQERWYARELQSPLGYARWENFDDTVERAKAACQNSGHEIDDHFRGVTKTSPMPNGGTKEIQDYQLSRFACYLTAMNGDPRKPEIAAAQAYFAIKTREAELTQENSVSQEQPTALAWGMTLTQFKLRKWSLRVVVTKKGVPWFVAEDACALLGLDASAITRLNGMGVDRVDIAGQQMTIIHEPNLYCLTAQSSRPYAKTIMDWVHYTIVPSLRADDRYSLRGERLYPAHGPTDLAAIQQHILYASEQEYLWHEEHDNWRRIKRSIQRRLPVSQQGNWAQLVPPLTRQIPEKLEKREKMLAQTSIEVLDVLKQQGKPLHPKELALIMGKPLGMVKTRLSRMKQKGEVKNTSEGYIPLI